MKIRRCTLNDLNSLRFLSIKTFNDTFGRYNTAANMKKYFKTAYNLSTLKFELTNPESKFYFAYHQGQRIGYLKLNLSNAQSEPFGNQYLEIERIYLIKSAQRQGFGTQLINYATREAKRNHKQLIWLGVWKKNYQAQKFYQKMGFKFFGSHVFKLGDDPQMDLLMRKALTR